MVIVDDMIDTAGTMAKASDLMKKMEQIVCVQFVHTLFYQVNAYENINNSCIEELVVTDSLP